MIDKRVESKQGNILVFKTDTRWRCNTLINSSRLKMNDIRAESKQGNVMVYKSDTRWLCNTLLSSSKFKMIDR